MKLLLTRTKDYKVYVSYGEYYKAMYTIEELSGKVIDHTESYQDAVQSCRDLQSMLDSEKYVARVKKLRVCNVVFVTRDYYVTADIFVKSKSLLIDRTVFKIRKRSDDTIFFTTDNIRNATKLCIKLQRIADISEGNNEI